MQRQESIKLYPFPRYPDDVVYEGGFASEADTEEDVISIDEFVRNIDKIIDEYLEELELKEKHPDIDAKNTRFLSTEERGFLQKKLREDDRVFENAMGIIKSSKPELFDSYRPKELYSFIGILDWNDANKTSMSEAFYKKPNLVVRDLKPLHSYMVQVTRSGHPIGEIDSPSVSGIVVAEDEEMGTIFPIGYRAGRHLENTAMTVPAGSVQIPKVVNEESNPIFDTFFDELESEMGHREVYNVRIIGHHFDPYVGGNTLFVVLADSMLDKEEMLESFEHAKDRYEHDHLMWKKFDPREILTDLVVHDLPYDKDNLPKVPDEKVPYLYPLKQSLVALMTYLSSVRLFSRSLYDDPNSLYPIKYNM